jgi:hypothetical protein
MPNTKPWVAAAVAFALTGCVSSSVQRGTLIGAASGAVLGAGTGLLISDDKLLGSSKESKVALDRGEAVGASLLVGTVFGAIVGAMIGHGNDHSDRESQRPAASAQVRAPAAF